MAGINLDALLGEISPRPLTYKGQEFELPGELPAAALAPFFDPELGLVDLLAEVFAEDNENTDNVVDLLLSVLRKRPTLPVELLAAGKAALSELLGEHADAFFALKPSVNAYFALASNLGSEYGFSLTDFFGSADSSETAGTTSSATSSITTGSMPAESGDAQDSPGSSDSAASES